MPDKSEQELNVEPVEEDINKPTNGDSEIQSDENFDQDSSEEDKTDNYLFFKGLFNYGGRTKTYGLVSFILNKDKAELVRFDLLEKDNTLNIRLTSNLQEIADFYREEFNNYRSQRMAEELSVSFTRETIEKVIASVNNEDLEQVKELVREKLEDILQESINIDADEETISQSELETVYPEIFSSEEDSESEESGDSELDNGGFTNNNQGLNARLELKCSPVISAIRGRRVSQLEPGDKLLVDITDGRDLGKDIGELLQRHKGSAVGRIEEIDYNDELDRYRVLVKFKRNIYGRLIADPEVKITVFNDSDSELPKLGTKNKSELSREIILLFAGLGIIVLLLIAIFIVIY